MSLRRTPSPRRKISRRRRKGWTAILLAVTVGLITVAFLFSRWHTPPGSTAGAAGPLHAEMLEVFGHRRPVEPWLSGFDTYAPCTPRGAEAEPVTCSSPPRLGDLVKIARGRQSPGRSARETAADLHLQGLWSLLFSGRGTSERALSDLERAALLEPDSAFFQNDLAAANLVLADETGDPTRLVDALEAADRALVVDGDLASALFNRALAFSRLGLFHEASSAWERFLDRPNLDGWAAEARRRRQDVEERTSEDLAESSHERFEELLLDEWPTEARGVETRLEKLRDLSRTIETTTGDRMALEIMASIDGVGGVNPGRWEAALFAYRRGLALYRSNDYGAADAELEAAEEGLRRLGNPLAEWASYYRAVCLWARDTRLALGRFEELRPRFEAGGYLRALAYVEWMVGLIETELGHFHEATAAYASAARRFEDLGLPGRVASLRVLQADVLIRLGEGAAAWRSLHEVLPVLWRHGTPAQQKTAHEEAAEALVLLERPRAALYFFDAALDRALADGDPNPISEVLAKRAELRFRLGDDSGSIEDIAEAHRWLDAISDPGAWNLAAAVIYGAESRILRSTEPLTSLRRIDELFEIYRTAGAELFLPALHLDRARVLLARGDLAAAEEDLLAAIQGAEAQRRNIDPATWRASFSTRNREAIESLMLLRIDVGRPPAELLPVADLLRDASFFVDSSTANDFVSLDGSHWESLGRESLPPDLALVSYAVVRNRVLIWVLRSGQTSFAEVELERVALERWIEHAGRLTSPAGVTLAAREELYRVLVEPVAEALHGARALVLALDRPLHRLAFASLRDPATGEVLLERHTLAVTPSVALFLTAAAERGRRGEATSSRVEPVSVLVVGDPRPSPFEPLPRAEDEARVVVGLYGEGKLLLKEAARRADLLERLGTTDVFHFAGHAVADLEAPERSILLLAGSTEGEPLGLTASEIRDLDLRRTKLVVLSACGTAETRSSDAAGVLSLAASFLAAGTGSVVATLGSEVSDRLAFEVLTAFHRELRAGHPPPDALRRAQLERLRQQDEPEGTEWAGFRVVTKENLK